MRDSKWIWLAGLGVTLIVIALPVYLFGMPLPTPLDNPSAALPQRPAHTDHTSLIDGEFASGQDVTRECLTCHPSAGDEVAHTAHFQWKGEPVQMEGRDELVSIGKSNLLSNFCIGIQPNWSGCTKCHAGYGWKDGSFDFTDVENVDCLVCHDQSGGYAKSIAGNPADGVDLLAAARSVSTPTRVNCGTCHFNGGGGNAVKHGDLDETLYFPSENIDVHMGEYNLQCVDCHQTENHQISGRAMSVSVDNANQTYCTDCHNSNPHQDERIASHLDSLACQTCHIPQMAVRDATKMEWDWSTAGQDLPENPHEYLKIKGSFVYESNVKPTYAWFDGTISYRYLLGDIIDPNGVTVMNQPSGSISDPNSLIYPFKVHITIQPYDATYNYLLQPQTVGEGGYWKTFDWLSALENGSKIVGLPFSGNYGFAQTSMYWVTTHMVQPAENALQCADCHGESDRFDWLALGYYGDPMTWGGRDTSRIETAQR